MAFLPFAVMNVLRRSSQDPSGAWLHQSTSMNPSLSFRMPCLYWFSWHVGDIKSRTMSTTFWKYFIEIFHPSAFSLKISYAMFGKTPHISWGSGCLNHATGAAGSSGPNTVNVFPDPDKPYAKITTALPSNRSALMLVPQAWYTGPCPINFMDFATAWSSPLRRRSHPYALHHDQVNANRLVVYLLLSNSTEDDCSLSCCKLTPSLSSQTKGRQRIPTLIDTSPMMFARGAPRDKCCAVRRTMAFSSLVRIGTAGHGRSFAVQRNMHTFPPSLCVQCGGVPRSSLVHFLNVTNMKQNGWYRVITRASIHRPAPCQIENTVYVCY